MRRFRSVFLFLSWLVNAAQALADGASSALLQAKPIATAKDGPVRCSSVVSGFTFLWCVFSGRSQSVHITRSFGSQYVKRPLLPLWVTSFMAMLLIGAAGEVLT